MTATHATVAPVAPSGGTPTVAVCMPMMLERASTSRIWGSRFVRSGASRAR